MIKIFITGDGPLARQALAQQLAVHLIDLGISPGLSLTGSVLSEANLESAVAAMVANHTQTAIVETESVVVSELPRKVRDRRKTTPKEVLQLIFMASMSLMSLLTFVAICAFLTGNLNSTVQRMVSSTWAPQAELCLKGVSVAIISNGNDSISQPLYDKSTGKLLTCVSK